MDDPFLPTKKSFDLGHYRVERMILSPEHWSAFTTTHALQWKVTKFVRTNQKTIPRDEYGVYSFLVMPEIAGHPACSYLMYVGKAEKQSLQQRFEQYFSHIGETSRRTNISKMLRLWNGHLWFCYAPVSDQSGIDALEQSLLDAFLPPFNKKYKGVVAKQLRYLFS